MQTFEPDQVVYVRFDTSVVASINEAVLSAFTPAAPGRVYRCAEGRYLELDIGDSRYPHRVYFPSMEDRSEIFRDSEVSATRFPEEVVDYAVTDEGGVV